MSTCDPYTDDLLRNFAESYHLKAKRDECNDPIIEGRLGHIYTYSDSELGVLILPPTYKPRLYCAIKKKCLSVGMTPHQDCDGEGTFTFDPNDKKQARMAIKVAEVRPKKQISEEHKKKLLSGLQTYRDSVADPILEGGFTC